MISLIVPSYAGGTAIERTIQSVDGVCDDVVIISTAIFEEDKERFKSLGTVVELPWNFVFLHGYGSLSNQGTHLAKNDWMLLFGVGETFAESFCGDMRTKLSASEPGLVFSCNHVNDKYTWKRIWNRKFGSAWSGIIHEEIISGYVGGLLFRMQDTEKEPRSDALQQSALRHIKALSYNWLYLELLNKPERLGGANVAWLKFVEGARDSIQAFCAEHRDLLDCCISGDLAGFLSLVEKRLPNGKAVDAVNFKPLGQ